MNNFCDHLVNKRSFCICKYTTVYLSKSHLVLTNTGFNLDCQYLNPPPPSA